MRKKSKGILLVQDDAKALNEYVGTVLAPKSLYPLAVYTTSDGFRLVSPDLKRYIGAAYYGGNNQADDCIRQHMSPGLVDKSDRGQGLGTALYLAGNMVRASEVPSSEEACTYSLENDRNSSASAAWGGLFKHGLASSEGVTEHFSDEIDADRLGLIDADDFEGYFEWRRSDKYTGVEIDAISGHIRVEGTRTSPGNQMLWDTVKDSGLVLHLNTEDHSFEDKDYTPPPPIAFAKIDWTHTPYTLFQDIVEQNAYETGNDAKDYVLEVVTELNRAGKRRLAEYAKNSIQAAYHTGRRETTFRGHTIRVNPSAKKAFAKYNKEWLADYTKGKWD